MALRRSDSGARRQDIRRVVHQREEVFIGGGQPDEPVVGDRELGGRVGGCANGLERECYVFVLVGYGTLSGAVRHTVSEVAGG